MRAPAAAATLVLVRHPHTAANEGGGVRMSGWTDVPLSARGVREAELLRARLAAGPAFAAIYTSPLGRARELAALLARDGGAPRVERDLAEISCGAVDGWHVDEVRARHPELWRRNERQDDPAFRWPGGESYLELRARCVGAAGRIAAAHPGERVAVVTHAGVVAQVLGFIAGASPACWGRFRPENASLTVVEWSGQGARLVSFDDRAHLAPPVARAVA